MNKYYFKMSATAGGQNIAGNIIYSCCGKLSEAGIEEAKLQFCEVASKKVGLLVPFESSSCDFIYLLDS